MIGIDEQLRVVELLIERAKRRGDGLDNDMIAPLRATARDLRARLDAPAGRTLSQLEDKLRGVLRSKTSLGYSMDNLADLATYVVGNWSAIRLALEEFREGAE